MTTASQPSERVHDRVAESDLDSTADSGLAVIHRTAVLIPVLPNLHPDEANRVDGLLTELGPARLCCAVAADTKTRGGKWVIGVEQDDFALHFVTAVSQGWRDHGNLLESYFDFVAPDQDPLAPSSLIPQFQLGAARFGIMLPEDVIAAWVMVGVARPVLMHRIYVCPDCRAIPLFGAGCRNCGGVRLAKSQLIHHFCCAHVGYVDEFLEGGDIVCPKCRVRGLVVGADFENLDGPRTCLDCAFTSTELEHVGHCLQCGLRFPLLEAVEHEVSGYDVARLDPLALLDGI